MRSCFPVTVLYVLNFFIALIRRKLFSLFYIARAGGRAAELERKSTRVNILPPKMLQPGEKLSDKLREKENQEAEML